MQPTLVQTGTAILFMALGKAMPDRTIGVKGHQLPDGTVIVYRRTYGGCEVITLRP
jgi:hypothetical protein